MFVGIWSVPLLGGVVGGLVHRKRVESAAPGQPAWMFLQAAIAAASLVACWLATLGIRSAARRAGADDFRFPSEIGVARQAAFD